MYDTFAEQQAFRNGYSVGNYDGYEAGIKTGRNLAAKEDIPVFYGRVVNLGYISHYPVHEIVCEWKGVMAKMALTREIDFAKYPETMLLDITDRLMWQCFQEWAKRRGYLK